MLDEYHTVLCYLSRHNKIEALPSEISELSESLTWLNLWYVRGDGYTTYHTALSIYLNFMQQAEQGNIASIIDRHAVEPVRAESLS